MSSDSERLPPPETPEAFESLCLDLWKDIWGDTNAQKNGRSGQAQAGVDVSGQDQGNWVGVQCKQKDDLLWTEVTVGELETEVAKALLFKPPLSKFILATSGLASVKVQERARSFTTDHQPGGLFSVAVWSWREIWHEIHQRPVLLKIIGPVYWPALWLAFSESHRTKRAGLTTVPPYNAKFTGRRDGSRRLRESLNNDDRTGIISGIHGLGGIGKSELAFAYAHEFSAEYPGGRFLIGCENKSSLRDAVLGQSDFLAIFRDEIRDEERKQPDSHFAAVIACLRDRLAELGQALILLENVTDSAVLVRQQTDYLTVLGPKLHLLATTRLAPPNDAPANWLRLGELPEADALTLLEKHRGFANVAERGAALRIVKRLGGFTLAVELVAAHLAAHPGVTCAQIADTIGLAELEDPEVLKSGETIRYNHDRRLTAVLGPVLASLKPPELRALEYAAFLPPDHAPLPWLRTLVVADFPEIGRPALLTSPWDDLWQRLEKLALFGRSDSDGSEPRLVRVHRLVQQLIRRGLSESDGNVRKQAVDALVEERDAGMEKTTSWDEANWELEPLTALARLWDGAQHARAAWLLDQIGVRLYQLAEWSQAEPLLRRALAIEEISFGLEHPNVAIRLNNLAQLLKATNRLGEAEPLMRRALAILEKSLGPEHPKVAIRLNNLAQLLQATNRLGEAEPLMRRALAIDEKSFGPEHPNVAIPLNNLAALLRHTNRLGEAEPLMRRALAIDEKSSGQAHPNVARDLNNLALLLRDTNRLGEAEPLMRRALAIDEKSSGQAHPNVARDLNNLALLLRDTNRLGEAEPLVRRALAIDEQSFGPTHPNVAISLHNLARLLRDTNRLGEAEPLIQRALAIDEKSFGPGHPNVARDLNTLALLLRDTNRPGEAESLIQRALAIDEHSFGSAHPDVARDLDSLARLLQNTNRLGEAEPLRRRQLEILITFTRATGHPHLRLQDAIRDYRSLLRAMERTEEEILAQLRAMAPDLFPGSEGHVPDQK